MNYIKRRLGTYTALLFSVIALDRLTKYLMLIYPDYKQINSLLSFDLQFNRGIAGGMLGNYSNTMFIGLTALIGIFIVSLIFYTYVKWMNVGWIVPELLVLGGAISNYYDRLYYKGVIDFISLSYQGWHWPTFNIADVAICIGVAMMFLEQSRQS